MMTKTESLIKMKEKGAYDALMLRTAASSGELTETEIIDREFAAPTFDNTKDYSAWPVNSPIQDEGQVWLLLQPHNAAHYEGRPSTLRALWGLAHTKNPNKAKPYVAPDGTSGLYHNEECMLWSDGKVYVSIIDNNSWNPADYPAGWEVVTA